MSASANEEDLNPSLSDLDMDYDSENLDNDDEDVPLRENGYTVSVPVPNYDPAGNIIMMSQEAKQTKALLARIISAFIAMLLVVLLLIIWIILTCQLNDPDKDYQTRLRILDEMRLRPNFRYSPGFCNVTAGWFSGDDCENKSYLGHPNATFGKLCGSHTIPLTFSFYCAWNAQNSNACKSRTFCARSVQEALQEIMRILLKAYPDPKAAPVFYLFLAVTCHGYWDGTQQYLQLCAGGCSIYQLCYDLVETFPHLRILLFHNACREVSSPSTKPSTQYFDPEARIFVVPEAAYGVKHEVITERPTLPAVAIEILLNNPGISAFELWCRVMEEKDETDRPRFSIKTSYSMNPPNW